MKTCIIATVLFLFSLQACRAQEEILIAAASDLKFAMDSLINVFEKGHSGKVNVTYGSSGKLSEQIVHGGPFDVFFSADISYPEQLRSRKLTASNVYPYALGSVVIWSKTIDTSNGMKSLQDPAVKKIAIANPAHAPYGKRAIESIDYYKLTESVKSKLVYGENISQTAQFISSGAADIGIIALSIALSPNMKREQGNYFKIPDEAHLPLIQGAVITMKGKGNKLATSFFQFIQSRQAVEVFEHFGFTKP